MKRIKKVLAVVLVLVMSMALAAGCSKSRQTMFGIMKDAGTMTKYSYDINAKLASSISGLENLSLTFNGETDGEAMAMGVKVSYSFITVDVDNFLTITKDAVYVNVQTLFDKLAPILLGASYSLEDFEEEFGTELKCIKLPLVDGMVNLNGGSNELMDTYISILESAFKDVKIEENKGEFTVRVEGAEEFSKLADALITALLDNEDTIISALEKSNVDDEMVKKLVDTYMDEFVAALDRFNKEYELGLTDEDIASLKEEVLNAFEEATGDAQLDDVSASYKEMFDELRTNKDDFVSEIAGLNGTADLTITNSLTGKEGSRVYSCTSVVNAESTDTDEDISLNIDSVMTESNDISVKAPESYTEFSDIIYAALVYAYDNGLLDDVLYDAY